MLCNHFLFEIYLFVVVAIENRVASSSIPYVQVGCSIKLIANVWNTVAKQYKNIIVLRTLWLYRTALQVHVTRYLPQFLLYIYFHASSENEMHCLPYIVCYVVVIKNGLTIQGGCYLCINLFHWNIIMNYQCAINVQCFHIYSLHLF